MLLLEKLKNRNYIQFEPYIKLIVYMFVPYFIVSVQYIFDKTNKHCCIITVTAWSLLAHWSIDTDVCIGFRQGPGYVKPF